MRLRRILAMMVLMGCSILSTAQSTFNNQLQTFQSSVNWMFQYSGQTAYKPSNEQTQFIQVSNLFYNEYDSALEAIHLIDSALSVQLADTASVLRSNINLEQALLTGDSSDQRIKMVGNLTSPTVVGLFNAASMVLYNTSGIGGIGMYQDAGTYNAGQLNIGYGTNQTNVFSYPASVGANFSDTLPNKSGTIAMKSDIPSLTGYATTTALTDSVQGRVKYSDSGTVYATNYQLADTSGVLRGIIPTTYVGTLTTGWGLTGTVAGHSQTIRADSGYVIPQNDTAINIATRAYVNTHGGTTYSAGRGLGLSGSTFSLDTTQNYTWTGANTWTNTAGQTISISGSATNTVVGLNLLNPTGATSVTPQYAPALELSGYGYKTGTGGGSEPTVWQIRQGITNGNSILDTVFFTSIVNGSPYVAMYMLGSSAGSAFNGAMAANGGLSVSSGFTLVSGAFKIQTGTNRATGTATLSSGTVTVSNTLVTSSSEIWVQYQSGGTLSGATLTRGLRVSTQTAGTSFVIVAETAPGTTNTADNSPVQWQIVN